MLYKLSQLKPIYFALIAALIYLLLNIIGYKLGVNYFMGMYRWLWFVVLIALAATIGYAHRASPQHLTYDFKEAFGVVFITFVLAELFYYIFFHTVLLTDAHTLANYKTFLLNTTQRQMTQMGAPPAEIKTTLDTINADNLAPTISKTLLGFGRSLMFDGLVSASISFFVKRNA
jgi:hypothetical protein